MIESKFNDEPYLSRHLSCLEVSDIGTLTIDIAYGGDSFIVVDPKQLGIELDAINADKLAKIGAKYIRPLRSLFGRLSLE